MIAVVCRGGDDGDKLKVICIRMRRRGSDSCWRMESARVFATRASGQSNKGGLMKSINDGG